MERKRRHGILVRTGKSRDHPVSVLRLVAKIALSVPADDSLPCRKHRSSSERRDQKPGSCPARQPFARSTLESDLPSLALTLPQR